MENGYAKNGKPVRYDFDAALFSNFTWKGYVHLNKNLGEVSQNISVTKPGTFRMIIRYLNQNPNITELFIRVRHQDNVEDEQNATLYLMPNMQPSFETVTIKQISALILELEVADYVFSFESKVDNFYIDHFVLLPSDYFESTVLSDTVDIACQDYRDTQPCIQYKYPSIERFSPQKLEDSTENTVDIDSIKEFNHTYVKPFRAAVLDPRNSLSKSLTFGASKLGDYVLLVDFMNTNTDGKEIQVDITNADSDSNKKQSGKVFLYACNITTLCREVLLSKDFNEPLIIKGKSGADFKFSTSDRQDGQILIYQVTLVPRDKFAMNHIKMAPYCLVKDKRCLPLEYQHFQAHKIELETLDNSGRQDLFRAPSADSNKELDYIPKNKVIYLNNFFVSGF